MAKKILTNFKNPTILDSVSEFVFWLENKLEAKELSAKCNFMNNNHNSFTAILYIAEVPNWDFTFTAETGNSEDDYSIDCKLIATPSLFSTVHRGAITTLFELRLNRDFTLQTDGMLYDPNFNQVFTVIAFIRDNPLIARYCYVYGVDYRQTSVTPLRAYFGSWLRYKLLRADTFRERKRRFWITQRIKISVKWRLKYKNGENDKKDIAKVFVGRVASHMPYLITILLNNDRTIPQKQKDNEIIQQTIRDVVKGAWHKAKPHIFQWVYQYVIFD